MTNWLEAKTWMKPQIVLAGDLFQTALQYELIVGLLCAKPADTKNE
jgi:hypothetical protein